MKYLLLFIVLLFLISCEARKRRSKRRRRDNGRSIRRSTSSEADNSAGLSDWTPAGRRERTQEATSLDYTTQENNLFKKVYRRAGRSPRRTRQRRRRLSRGRSRGHSRGRNRSRGHSHDYDRRRRRRGETMNADFPFSPSFQAMVRTAQDLQAQRRHRHDRS